MQYSYNDVPKILVHYICIMKADVFIIKLPITFGYFYLFGAV